MRLDFLSTNNSATIVSVNAVITQSFVIHYSDPTMTATPPEERHILAKVSPSAKPRPYSTEAADCTPSTSAPPREPRTRWPTPARSRGRTRSPLKATLTDLPEGGSCQGVGDELVEVDQTPLAEVEAGSEWSYQRVMRVPNDDFVRATTLDGTDDRVRVSHVLGVEVRYRVKGDTSDKMMRIAKGITITSVSHKRPHAQTQVRKG